MLKKLLYFSIILLIAMLFINISYATDIVSSFNNTSNIGNIDQNANQNISQTIDSTTYTSNPTEQDIVTDYEQVATTTTEDYDSEAELSISNMINIILIVVGVVLILLGIAIIIKLK